MSRTEKEKSCGRSQDVIDNYMKIGHSFRKEPIDEDTESPFAYSLRRGNMYMDESRYYKMFASQRYRRCLISKVIGMELSEAISVIDNELYKSKLYAHFGVVDSSISETDTACTIFTSKHMSVSGFYRNSHYRGGMFQIIINKNMTVLRRSVSDAA